jgi:hypothetical protein
MVATVRSPVSFRSSWAKTTIIITIASPIALEVSIFSLRLLNSTPCSAKWSHKSAKSSTLRVIRSSLTQTTISSRPSAASCRSRWSWGRFWSLALLPASI